MVRRLSVGLDVDEVLNDLHTPWLAWGNERFHTKLAIEDFDSWNAPIARWGPDACRFINASIYNLDVVKPIPLAARAVSLLRRDCSISFVTSCPNNTAEAKRFWLQRHGFYLPGDGFYPMPDKTNAPVDVLVDDGIHNVEGFRGYSFLVTRYHNLCCRVSPNIPRISHVWELLHHLT